MVITTPVGRGKGTKAWARTVDAIAKNANSGRDWAGTWMVAGAEQEVEPGDMIVVGDADGCGAAVYVAYMMPANVDGVPQTKPTYMMVECDDTEKWGAKLAVATRKWLAMDAADRIQSVLEVRLGVLEGYATELPSKPDKTYFGANGEVAMERIASTIALCRSMLSPTATLTPVWAAGVSDADLIAEMKRRGL